MEYHTLPKQILEYHPTGRQGLECHPERQLDDLNAETEMGQPSDLMDDDTLWFQCTFQNLVNFNFILKTVLKFQNK
jgi:hypothetical protein